MSAGIRVICRKTNVYPYHLVVNTFNQGQIPRGYKELKAPVLYLSRAKNINHENVAHMLDHTGKTVMLRDKQFVKYGWGYNREWSEHQDLHGVKVISLTKLAEATAITTTITGILAGIGLCLS